jgi:ABC-type sugar transport system permease subunit
VVLYPAVELIRASFNRYSITGLFQRSVGLDNYARLVEQDALPRVAANTAVWVVVVVGLTLLISLALAQLVNARFPGRRLVRLALIVPWAASLIITAKLFAWIYDYYFGLPQPRADGDAPHRPADRLARRRPDGHARDDRGGGLRLAAVHHLCPARGSLVDRRRGVRGRPRRRRIRWRTYRSVTLPLLRPALLVATVLNAIYVFNSFPIIWTLNDRNPGFAHDTLITYMYKIAFKSAQRDVGLAAALGVVNVAVILLAVLAYLRTVRWQEDGS